MIRIRPSGDTMLLVEFEQRIDPLEADALAHSDQHSASAVVEIPVRYGGDDGPDLAAVAAWAKCTPAEVIARHSQQTYRVYMLGFVPGFSYMGSVDASIAAPRHRISRERVPAGSVGIAGEQTGVYPGSVIAADLPIAGQLAPGDFIEFDVCGRQQAATALIARERPLLRFADAGRP